MTIYESTNLREEPDPLAKQYGTRSLSSMTWWWANSHNQWCPSCACRWSESK